MKLIRAVFSYVRELCADLGGMETLDLAPRLTLFLLILYGADFWYLRIPMRVLCIAGLLTSRIYRNSLFWFALASVSGFGVGYNWFTSDNHKYLMTYWCLAMSISLQLPDGARILAANAKIMVGICFAFAVLWKGVLSTDYLDGSFFKLTLLTDDRFRSFSNLLGGMTKELSLMNAHLLDGLRNSSSEGYTIHLRYPQRLELLAFFMTWSVLLVESLVAIAFLCPADWPIGRLRHSALLLFAIGTYAVATVAGFGWLLLVMGVAQCPPAFVKTRVAYVLVFFLIQVYTAPWGSFLQT